jgi:aminopeptidase
MLIAASSIDFAQLRARAEKLMPLFRNGDVNISASNGTNLNLRLIGREVSADDCVVDSDDLDKGRNVANIPGGYVLACPDEEYADGTVIFDKPTVYMGRWVRGVRLEFKQNRLVDYQAGQGAEHLKASYERASGDKNKIAAVEVGINAKARTGFLQDSLASGVVTVGIGANDDVGGANKSDFYFEGVITKATLTVDGKVIVQNGKLSI